MTNFIYTLEDPREPGVVRYLGRTNNPQKRLYQHLYQHRNWPGRPTHKIHWISSVLDQGLAPVMEVLEEIPDGTPEEEIRKTEEFYISYLKSLGAPLTNGTPKSAGVVQHTPEALAKMAEFQRNRKAEVNQKISKTLKGRKMSPEQYAKHMERVNSPEWKARMSQVHKGKKLSQAEKDHISEVQTGRKRSAETCKNISAALKGHVKSEEHRRNMALSHLGKPMGPQTPEQIAKRVEATKRTKLLKKQLQLDTQPQPV